jgi:NTE family protein
MGADFIIASNVVPDMQNRVYRSKIEQMNNMKEPNIIDVITRTIHIAAYQAVRFSKALADIVIEPQVAHIGFGDFHRLEECILQGKLAAQSSIPEIKKMIGNQARPS